LERRELKFWHKQMV